jgi:hypothetical protein
LDTCSSPAPSRRGATPESPPQSTPSPVSQGRSSSLTSSNELLIIEDEEEYLIQKLAADAVSNEISSFNNKQNDVKLENIHIPVTDQEPSPKVKESHENNLPLDLINNKKDIFETMETHNDDLNEMNRQESINDLTSVDSANDLTSTEAEMFFKSLKEKLERPDVTKEFSQVECPLTHSLQYLDAALSLFQLEDMPVRAADAPRSKASTKRRLYSAASPLSLLSPDPALMTAPTLATIDDKCTDCGTPFPVPSARFCCLCGARRANL